jgi:WD40 repeat protein
LDWPPAPCWAAISCQAPSTCASSGASDQLCFVWDGSKGKSNGLNQLHTYRRYYYLVCVLRRSILDWPPAPCWAAISCLAPSTCASSGASDRLCFVWDGSKGKSNGSNHHRTYRRYYNLLCVLRRSILDWPPAPQ